MKELGTRKTPSMLKGSKTKQIAKKSILVQSAMPRKPQEKNRKGMLMFGFDDK